jgi:septum formation protein
MNRPLILASASPRRSDILNRLGYVFVVVPAAIEEHEPEATADPRALVAHNAALKADWVAARHRDAVVLGADTAVFLNGEVFNKPIHLDDARRMLRRLAGQTHTVCTAVAVRSGGQKYDIGVESRVTFRAFGDAVIDQYFSRGNPLDKAGAYGIQEGGDLLVDRYTGSLTNVVGLPAKETKELLIRAGVSPTL